MAASVPAADTPARSAPLRAAQDFVLQLKPQCHVLVAVSGGGDSIGLLSALLAAKTISGRNDISFTAATVDHGLRPEAADEALWVGAFCAERGIAHHTLVWADHKPQSGLMVAARDARYRLLSALAGRCGADVIAVAHTMDDQAETFAMRASRGASTVLTGMADKTLIEGKHWIARPFLKIGRSAIRDFLTLSGLSWIDDPSNDDAHYERVRTRRSIRETVETLAADAEKAAQARDRLSRSAADLFADIATIHGATVAQLDIDGLLGAGDAGRYLLNILVPALGGLSYGPGGDVLDRVTALCTAPHGARMTAGRCLFERHRGHLFILRERRGLPEAEIAPGEKAVWDGRFCFENRSQAALRIRPAGPDGAGDTDAFARLPPRLARLAAAVRPVAMDTAGKRVFPTGVYLAPFDRFLPGFDLALANMMAAAFTHAAYREPATTYLR
ncbi:UNVERIFIED_ORG: tRNA(Ile)-lysidine synthase [Martelella mediterranea]